jgi:phospholipase C
MRSLRSFASRLSNGFAALTVSVFILLLAVAPPAFGDGNNGQNGQDVSHQLHRIGHIIVIYQENWSFDSLYGLYPGADGLANGFGQLPQRDKTTGYASLIYTTPSPLNPVPTVDPQFPKVGMPPQLALKTAPLPLPLIPYDFSDYILASAKTGDIIHRFYHEQLQIDNGALETKLGDNDKFVTWSDNPGLVLSYLDATGFPEGVLAQKYVLCDKFFHSAYGGSFLNHQWLIAASTPPWTKPIPGGFQSSWNGTTLADNNLTIDGTRAVNTTQPSNAPFSPGTPLTKRLSINNTDKSKPGYTENIGNRLDDAKIDWRWYAGGWNDALSNNKMANDELFQFHHQPFAYYTKYAPFADPAPDPPNPPGTYTTTPPLNPATTGPNAHLQDEKNFLLDVASGHLPPVAFVKPIGLNNEHPGYTDELTGQQHVADLVKAVQQSPIWRDCVIIITYDENGGRWDHVPPPVRPDGWGVGVRVPTIVVSPFVGNGVIDDHEYETVSILKLIERRFGLAPLSARDANPAVSDLTTVFQFKGEDD